jgi:hypothetical protein
VNVALLYVVVRAWTRSARLACLAAAFWGTTPINQETLGWYAVYGHVLATTLLFAVLADLARLQGPVTPRRALTWALVLLVGSTAFGVGLAVGVVFPLAAVLLLPSGALGRRALLILAALAPVVLATYAGVWAVRELLYGQSAEAVFDLIGRVMSWTVVVGMTLHLMAFATAEVVLGALTGASGYPSPASWAVVGLALAVVAVAAARAPADVGRRLAGLILLALAAYALIALGRANLYAMVIHYGPERSSTVERYHYLGSAVLAVTLAVALAPLAARWRLPTRVWDVALVSVLALGAAVRVLRGMAIDHHDVDRRQAREVLDAVETGIATTPPGGDVYVRNRFFQPLFMVRGPRAVTFPGSAAVFMLFYPENTVDGRRIHFVDGDRNLLHDAKSGPPRLAELLVSPEEATKRQ